MQSKSMEKDKTCYSNGRIYLLIYLVTSHIYLTDFVYTDFSCKDKMMQKKGHFLHIRLEFLLFLPISANSNSHAQYHPVGRVKNEQPHILQWAILNKNVHGT